MIKFLEEEFEHELGGYRKFCRFRDGAEQRPWTSVASDRLPRRLAEQRKEIRGRDREAARPQPGRSAAASSAGSAVAAPARAGASPTMSAPAAAGILIVDDEEAILETMTYTFEDDYEVLTAPIARRALELLDEHAPVAAVITDQRMPDMTGVEFLARVCEKHPTTTRIILTGFADMEAILRAINDGHVYAYITKPWEPDQLKQVVQRAVEPPRAAGRERAPALGPPAHERAARGGDGPPRHGRAGGGRRRRGPGRQRPAREATSASPRTPRGRRLGELLSRAGHGSRSKARSRASRAARARSRSSCCRAQGTRCACASRASDCWTRRQAFGRVLAAARDLSRAAAAALRGDPGRPRLGARRAAPAARGRAWRRCAPSASV